MKSVVILSTANLYYGNTAAVARMNNYARSLIIKGIYVYLLCADYLRESHFLWKEVEPHLFCLSVDQTLEKRSISPFSTLHIVKAIKDLISNIRGDVSILNYPSTRSLVLDIGLLFYLRRYPIFCEVNEVRRFSSDSDTKSFKSKLINYVLERTYRYYTGVIFISKHIQAFYSSLVRNSIIIPILSDCKKSFVVSSGIDSLVFVFVGSLYFQKENLEELLEGFCLFARQHPNAMLKLFGFLPDKDKDILNRFLERERLRGRISYCGSLQHSEVAGVLSSAGALILPRSNNKQNYYGFSTKLSEYAVSGTPIIMTNTGVVADFFEDGVNCLMCEGYDRDSFYRKFNEFAQMRKEDKERLSENAYHLAASHFDYRLYADCLSVFLFGKE